ncbi:hypothetical protein TRFO_37489 [Tritrichomonas foetus]|uniref:Uncharacterized protein n=1 Tax=Tritrichomonas foetus TaxID=1144522 RepID=A0A1J4JFF5_9EUKA|nr:hypothetical protein TRFO_37489 [Tritrichomonas foetus]|eukprot:OHS96379.1 hypothetical protein TRFO_37489 [Tritrichomonas foetus]
MKPKIITTIDEASFFKCICPCKCSCTDEFFLQEQAQDELPESTVFFLQRQDHKSKQNEKWIPEMEKYHEYDKRKENIPAFEIKEDIKSPDLIKGGDPEDMPGMKPNYETKHKNNAKKMHRKHSTRVRSFITLNVKFFLTMSSISHLMLRFFFFNKCSKHNIFIRKAFFYYKTIISSENSIVFFLKIMKIMHINFTFIFFHLKLLLYMVIHLNFFFL